MPSELATLYNLAMWCPPGARVLEIGSYLGASTCYLGAALAHRGGTLTCVDTWQNQTMPEGERDTYGEFLRNVAPIHDRLTLVRKRAEDLTPADIPGPYDLVFLDGDHSYAATRRDFDLVRERVAGDGVVAFHDCAEWEGVSHVIGEALACGQWALVGKVDNLMWMRRANWSHASPQSRRELPSVDP
ncbi:MAG TPA: class I SAM-dependent methyltransferase [Gemmataceae bacterium]|nr:class I SAM-dependent methyltransferase [Gemmataceae bacterium]